MISLRYILTVSAATFFGNIFIATAVYAQSPADKPFIDASRARYQAHIDSGGRYMERNCVPTSLPEWAGFPLQRCSYSHLGATAHVTMLNPSADQLARWSVTACRDAEAVNMNACIRHVERRIWNASNAQFPVSGYVIEPKSVLGQSPPNAPLCFMFRDGITMRTAAVTTRPPTNGECAPESAENDSATMAFRYARIASTTREEYASLPGSASIAQLLGVLYMPVIRAEYQAAWVSDRHRLISAAARADKIAGNFD